MGYHRPVRSSRATFEMRGAGSLLIQSPKAKRNGGDQTAPYGDDGCDHYDCAIEFLPTHRSPPGELIDVKWEDQRNT